VSWPRCASTRPDFLIGQYARHNGDADLLRERIDGVTGD
jgi:hypothetical protein